MVNQHQKTAESASMWLSSDGLVRLSLNTILSTHLSHLISGVDEEEPQVTHRACGKQTTVSGYTEWIGATEPALTIGWDWSIMSVGGEARWVRVGSPRSNIMLIDNASRDIEWGKNLEILTTFVDAIPWMEQTRQAIAARYT